MSSGYLGRVPAQQVLGPGTAKTPQTDVRVSTLRPVCCRPEFGRCNPRSRSSQGMGAINSLRQLKTPSNYQTHCLTEGEEIEYRGPVQYQPHFKDKEESTVHALLTHFSLVNLLLALKSSNELLVTHLCQHYLRIVYSFRLFEHTVIIIYM